MVAVAVHHCARIVDLRSNSACYYYRHCQRSVFCDEMVVVVVNIDAKWRLQCTKIDRLREVAIMRSNPYLKHFTIDSFFFFFLFSPQCAVFFSADSLPYRRRRDINTVRNKLYVFCENTYS